MSVEVAVVFDYDMKPIYWHLPPGRTASYIPDSVDLWEVLISNRDNIYGVAHSHPGFGEPSPSLTDIITFSACELGLGKRLLWPIISHNKVAFFMWLGSNKYDYQKVYVADVESYWLQQLRHLSY